ncbi:MAG: hypothetical protein ACW99A_07685 [Candidatus Kariarchaeaceae archaeon]
MSEDNSLFPLPNDEISKSWIESVIRGRLSGLSEDILFCIGPPDQNKVEIGGYDVCANSCVIKTHVHNEFVAFCDDHIEILHKYLMENN